MGVNAERTFPRAAHGSTAADASPYKNMHLDFTGTVCEEGEMVVESVFPLSRFNGRAFFHSL